MVGLAGRLGGSVLRVGVWSLVFGGVREGLKVRSAEASSSLGGRQVMRGIWEDFLRKEITKKIKMK